MDMNCLTMRLRLRSILSNAGQKLSFYLIETQYRHLLTGGLLRTLGKFKTERLKTITALA